MVRRVATRSQRRTEKRQILTLLTLVLVVSLVSFILGVAVGRSRKPAVAAAQPTRLPVAQPLPSTAAGAIQGERQSESLTFYDELAKGGKPPLGSGINLPPANSAAPDIASDTQELQKPTLNDAAGVEQPPDAVPSQPPTAAVVSAPPQPRKAAPAVEKGAYLVQAAAFRRVEDASSLQTRLGRKGYSAFTREIQLGDKGIWYRVYIGPFATAGSAEEVVSRLKAEEKLAAMVRKN